MEQEEKLDVLAEIFDRAPGTLTPETRLDTLGWDSMAMLSVIAVVKARFDRKIPGGELRTFETVGDILCRMEQAR